MRNCIRSVHGLITEKTAPTSVGTAGGSVRKARIVLSRRIMAAAIFLSSVLPVAAVDRPHAPPVADGLRDCAGGFILPGSETCLRLGGAVRQDDTLRTGRGADLSPTKAGGRSLIASGSTARVTLDARTPTTLGPVRVYMSVRSRLPGGDGAR
jgi:hypothetical protein